MLQDYATTVQQLALLAKLKTILTFLAGIFLAFIIQQLYSYYAKNLNGA